MNEPFIEKSSIKERTICVKKPQPVLIYTFFLTYPEIEGTMAHKVRTGGKLTLIVHLHPGVGR